MDRKKTRKVTTIIHHEVTFTEDDLRRRAKAPQDAGVTVGFEPLPDDAGEDYRTKRIVTVSWDETVEK